MVTSGAIALGMRLMGFDARPRAIDELQAASAVGQGSLFRAYEERLAERDVHAAQVLLNSSDVSTRVNYLNARATLRRLLQWRAVPVINENDTTATDEITFGDNDFLSAQVALLLGARLLVLLTDTAGPAHRRPAPRPRRAADRAGGRLRRARRVSRSATGRRRSARAGCAARWPRPRWRRRPASRSVVCDGTADGTLRAAAAGEAGRDDVPRPSGPGPELQALAALREAEPGHAWRSTRARRGSCASRARACCRSA